MEELIRENKKSEVNLAGLKALRIGELPCEDS